MAPVGTPYTVYAHCGHQGEWGCLSLSLTSHETFFSLGGRGHSQNLFSLGGGGGRCQIFFCGGSLSNLKTIFSGVHSYLFLGASLLTKPFFLEGVTLKILLFLCSLPNLFFDHLAPKIFFCPSRPQTYFPSSRHNIIFVHLATHLFYCCLTPTPSNLIIHHI